MKPAILLLALTSIALAQGPLNPSGPPGLTMRSLDEIEPRIPLNQTATPGDATCVFKITKAGSYMLTGNIKPPAGKHGIRIELLNEAAGVVEVDMKGFAIDGAEAGPGTSAMLCNNENVALEDDFSKFRNGTIRNFAGDACYQALPEADAITFVFHNITWLMNGAAVNTTGRLLMNDCSISGGTGTPIKSGNDSVLSGVEIKGSGGISGGIISTGDHAVLERVSLTWSFGASNGVSAVVLGPESKIISLTARFSGGTFSGPLFANNSGLTRCSYLDVDANNVAAATVFNSMVMVPADGCTAVTGPESAGLTSVQGPYQITANNCTFTNSAGAIPPAFATSSDNYCPRFKLTGTTTTPTVLRVEADNCTVHADISIAATATVSGAVIDIAASGTTIHANIRGGNVGVRLSSGTGHTVEGCSLIGLLVPAQAIKIESGVTNSLVRNNTAARLAAGGVLVQNNGGSSNFIAPIITTPAQLNANTNPFANIVH